MYIYIYTYFFIYLGANDTAVGSHRLDLATNFLSYVPLGRGVIRDSELGPPFGTWEPKGHPPARRGGGAFF